MKIVFIDPTCPRPYDTATLRSQGLGGTEATIVRIANALAATDEVVVCQHNRTGSQVDSPTLSFVSMDGVADVVPGADHVVFVKKAQGIGDLAGRTRARLWLWLHNYIVEEQLFYWTDHVRHRLGILCVSATHADHMRQAWGRLPANRLTLGFIGRGGVGYHHNPIDESLQPSADVARDPHKLVFFSSPHKGIEQVIAAFAEAQRRRPALRLFIADPGYLKMREPGLLAHPGIVHLGSIPQAEVARHVREAFCVFYPQSRRPETFGLVYAESNAVGTPVLAHDFGAAREVLSRANPPFDARDPEAVVARLFEWMDGGPPVVGPDPRFSIAAVTAGWKTFFDDPDAFLAARQGDKPPGR